MTLSGFLIAGILLIVGLAILSFPAFPIAWLACLAVATWWRPSVGVLLLLVGVPVDQVGRAPGDVVVILSEFEFAIVFLAWALKSERTPARESSVDWRPLVWGAPFCLLVLLSALVNNEWARVLPHTFRMVKPVLACFLAASALPSDAKHTAERWSLAIAALFYCGVGCIQFPEVPGGRVPSYFTNPNQFAGYLNLLLPFLLVLFFEAAGRRVRLFWGLLCLFLVFMMLATQSRAGITAALVAASLLWFLFYHDKFKGLLDAPSRGIRRFFRRSAPSLITVLFALCVLGALAASQPTFRTKMSEAQEIFRQRSWRGLWGSVRNSRLPYFDVGLQMWRDHWLLGIGPGNQRRMVRGRYRSLVEKHSDLAYYREFKTTIALHLHNLYLQLAVSVGLLGLLGFLYFPLRLLLALSTVSVSGDSAAVFPLAGMGLLTAFLIHNLLDVTYSGLGLAMGLFLGLALAGHQSVCQKKPASDLWASR